MDFSKNIFIWSKTSECQRVFSLTFTVKIHGNCLLKKSTTLQFQVIRNDFESMCEGRDTAKTCILCAPQNWAFLKMADTSWMRARNKERQSCWNVIFGKGALCSSLKIAEWLRNIPQCVKELSFAAKREPSYEGQSTSTSPVLWAVHDQGWWEVPSLGCDEIESVTYEAHSVSEALSKWKVVQSYRITLKGSGSMAWWICAG